VNTTILGRTGLKVSVLGLGTGGHSRLGLSQGKTPEHAANMVRLALDQGINFIDTSEIYNTEEAVGSGIQGRRREDFVLSTKIAPRNRDRIKTTDEIRQSLIASLTRLRVEYVDVYLVHAVAPDDYEIIERDFYPVLQRFREKGMLRFIGLSEGFGPDREHRMLSKALRSNCWDVIMTGFNYLNQSARNSVLPAAKEKNIGVLDMFAIRHALINQQRLQPIVTRLVQEGIVEKDAIDCRRPLQFLFDDAGVEDFTEAGYRFCLAEPGIHVVLTGSGNEEHLKRNIASVNKGPLDSKSRERLKAIFKNVRRENGDGA
jgi:L-galactose dehydrogenase